MLFTVFHSTIANRMLTALIHLYINQKQIRDPPFSHQPTSNTKQLDTILLSLFLPYIMISTDIVITRVERVPIYIRHRKHLTAHFIRMSSEQISIKQNRVGKIEHYVENGISIRHYFRLIKAYQLNYIYITDNRYRTSPLRYVLLYEYRILSNNPGMVYQ